MYLSAPAFGASLSMRTGLSCKPISAGTRFARAMVIIYTVPNRDIREVLTVARFSTRMPQTLT